MTQREIDKMGIYGKRLNLRVTLKQGSVLVEDEAETHFKPYGGGVRMIVFGIIMPFSPREIASIEVLKEGK